MQVDSIMTGHLNVPAPRARSEHARNAFAQYSYRRVAQATWIRRLVVTRRDGHGRNYRAVRDQGSGGARRGGKERIVC